MSQEPGYILSRLWDLRDRSQKTEENERRTSSMQRVNLTTEEILDYSKQQADAHGEAQQAEKDLASIKKQMQARIDGLQANIDRLNEALRNGYEVRDVAAVEILDHPKRGRKTTFRLDTREAIGETNMTAEDGQRMLRFEEEQKAAKTAEPKKESPTSVFAGEPPATEPVAEPPAE